MSATPSYGQHSSASPIMHFKMGILPPTPPDHLDKMPTVVLSRLKAIGASIIAGTLKWHEGTRSPKCGALKQRQKRCQYFLWKVCNLALNSFKILTNSPLDPVNQSPARVSNKPSTRIKTEIVSVQKHRRQLFSVRSWDLQAVPAVSAPLRPLQWAAYLAQLAEATVLQFAEAENWRLESGFAWHIRLQWTPTSIYVITKFHRTRLYQVLWFISISIFAVDDNHRKIYSNCDKNMVCWVFFWR